MDGYTEAADVFGFGLILFELITGKTTLERARSVSGKRLFLLYVCLGSRACAPPPAPIIPSGIEDSRANMLRGFTPRARGFRGAQ